MADDLDSAVAVLCLDLAEAKKRIATRTVWRALKARFTWEEVDESIKRWRAANKLEKTVAFRLTDADHRAYEAKYTASGLSSSEFFRRHVLGNTTVVIAKKTVSKDHQHLLYIANKTSNNVNQLAHRVHSHHLAGTVSERLYIDVLKELQRLSIILKAAVNNVD